MPEPWPAGLRKSAPPLGFTFGTKVIYDIIVACKVYWAIDCYVRKEAVMEEMKVRLSTLWIFVMFNMVFADIVGFLNPGTLEEMIAMKPAQGLLLVCSILLEISIAMIVLSRLLKHRANRWANIIAGATTILWVIGGGNTSVSYIFFATNEVACMVLIIWYAWKWTAR